MRETTSRSSTHHGVAQGRTHLWSAWRDRVILWILAAVASFGAAVVLAIWRWGVEYDMYAALCFIPSEECFRTAEENAKHTALTTFYVLFPLALALSTTFVFREQIFRAAQASDDRRRSSSIDEHSSGGAD